MDHHFPICHLFYYPTQVVLVDDDANFLDSVSLLLDRSINYRLFQSARQALEHVNKSVSFSDVIRRSYSSYKTGPFDSDTLTHIDINALHKEIYNADRFLMPSVVVIDYSMPEMSGLEYCVSLTNPYVKKILLTGRANTDLAVQAFNEGLIDQFISKKDPLLAQKLNRSIASLQHQYFSRTFKLLSDPVIANSQSRFVTNPEFIEFFNILRTEHGIVEYYLIDMPYSGFLLLDDRGLVSLLLIMPQTALLEHIRQCRARMAPKELLDALEEGAMIPLFNISNEGEHLNENFFAQWRKHYAHSFRVSDAAPYYTAQLGEAATRDLIPELHTQDIQSYAACLRAPRPSEKFLH
jgi:FixJ family two-component response regulator